MKPLNFKFLFLQFFVTIIFQQSTISQNWFEGSPSWSYKYKWECINSVNGWDKLKFQKDTIIDGKTCKLFKYFSLRGSFGSGTEYFEGHYILYENGGKVYNYNYWGFEKLYDFTLEIGDTIVTAINTIEGDSICENPLLSVIDTIYTTEISGHELTVQKWRNLNNVNEFGAFFTIVEKIGILGNFFFNMSYDWTCGLDHCHPYTFQCYFNEDLGINYPSHVNCQQILPVDEVNSEKLRTIIFPNPGNQIFNLKSDGLISSVKLYNLQGQLLKANYSNNKLDMNSIDSGIYVVHLFYEDGISEVQKIIKN